jgi:hypothetical protein
MRVVVFASVFPDSAEDRRALELARHVAVTAVVPTPWVPRPLAALSARWGAYARPGAVAPAVSA